MKSSFCPIIEKVEKVQICQQLLSETDCKVVDSSVVERGIINFFSLSIFSIDVDFTLHIKDAETVIFEAAESDVRFPTFPFLINHLRRQGAGGSAVKWFLLRQSRVFFYWCTITCKNLPAWST